VTPADRPRFELGCLDRLTRDNVETLNMDCSLDVLPRDATKSTVMDP